MNRDTGAKRKPENEQTEAAPNDEVLEASEESFPASDPPSWTGVTGEDGAGAAGKNAGSAESGVEGCTTSFIMDERGELGGACDELRPNPKEQYVQPDKEKEAGGES